MDRDKECVWLRTAVTLSWLCGGLCGSSEGLRGTSGSTRRGRLRLGLDGASDLATAEDGEDACADDEDYDLRDEPDYSPRVLEELQCQCAVTCQRTKKRICVRTLSGLQCETSVCACKPWTYLDLKRKVQLELGISLRRQRLVHDYRVPHGEEAVSQGLRGAESGEDDDADAEVVLGLVIRIPSAASLKSVKAHGHLLQFATTELRCDKEIVLAAVQSWGCALRYAAQELRGDVDIVLAAVKHPGGDGWPPDSVLQYASEGLRDNKQVVMAAVTGFPPSLQDASERLRADKEVVLAAVRSYTKEHQHVAKDKPTIETVMQQGASRMINPLHYAASALKDDKVFMMEVLQHSTDALGHASAGLRSASQLSFAAEELQVDKGRRGRGGGAVGRRAAGLREGMP
mmetsp:Transcript_54964/g.141491  ORF Transcript_54964/g.141491 Transcript_54964/m.141491 type:complete len:401 (+) Transcript_54964:188-1390(+)